MSRNTHQGGAQPEYAAEGQGGPKIGAELGQQHEAEAHPAQADCGEHRAAEAMAQLRDQHRANGQPQPHHGQQAAEAFGAEPRHADRQADRQGPQGRQQAVEQHQVQHRPAHAGLAAQKGQAVFDVGPHTGACAVPRRLIGAYKQQDQGGHSIGQGHQGEFAMADAQGAQQLAQQLHHRFAQGKAHDRGRHGGGGVERIGG